MIDEIIVHRFIVTIRWDFSKSDSSQSEWRGTILDVNSGKVVGFRHIDGITAAWRKITESIVVSAMDDVGSKTGMD